MSALTNQLEKLGREVKKIKESVHAIQVGCEICEGAHLAKDCPLKDDDEVHVEEVKYGDGRPFQGNSNGYRMGGKDITPVSTTGVQTVREYHLLKKPSANF